MQIPTRTIVKVLAITTAFIGLLFLAYMLQRELVWLIAAFSLALALNPLILKVTPYMPKKSRNAAVGVVFVGLISAAVLFAITLIPPLFSQSERLVNSLPGFTEQLLEPDSATGEFIRRYDLVERVQNSQSQLVARATQAGGSVVGIVQGFFSSLIGATTVLVLTFFMLTEGQTWRRRITAVLPDKYRSRVQRLSTEMYGTVTGYVNGKLLMSLLAAIPTIIILEILGVPYAISLGIIVGLFDLIPLIGATLGALIVVIVALFTSSTAAIVMIIFFAIYQQIENHVLQPIIFGKSVQISPLLVLVSILFGASIAGILGALIAIPVTASLQILLKELLIERQKANEQSRIA